MAQECEVCRKPARQFCSSCRSVFYCSKECQKNSWKEHKLKCKPYTIQSHPIYGRHMVATRDIRPGEIILRESPLVVGPKQLTQPICLGCHRTLKSPFACPSCHYPLCGPSCATSTLHKSECGVLSKAKSPVVFKSCHESVHPAYECVMPLRCLLLREQDSNKWQLLTTLQNHVQEIKNSEMHAVIQRNTVEYLREFMQYKGASEDEIYQVCGIVVVNSFEVRHNGTKVRAIYPQAAMTAHNCVPNTKRSFDSDLTLILRTTIPIRKGSIITANYTNVLWNTNQRRRQLKVSKFFVCSCERCTDPTELGTHFSTLVCSECGCSGNVHPNSTPPLHLDSLWVCQKCGESISAKRVLWGDQMLHRELKALDQTQAKPFQDFLLNYKNALHPGHRFFVEAKYALVNIYGNSPQHRYREMTQDELDNKVKYCRELLQLCEVISPGQSLLRGTLLLELQAALVALTRLLLSNDLIKPDDSKEYMTEAMGHLKEATEILRHEPEMKEGGLDLKLKTLSHELDL